MYEVYFTNNQSKLNVFFNSQEFLNSDSKIITLLSGEDRYYISKTTSSNNLSQTQWIMININNINFVVYDVQIYNNKKELISNFFKKKLTGEIYIFDNFLDLSDWINGKLITNPKVIIKDEKLHYKDVDISLSYIGIEIKSMDKYLIIKYPKQNKYYVLNQNLEIQELSFTTISFDNIVTFPDFMKCYITYNKKEAFEWMK